MVGWLDEYESQFEIKSSNCRKEKKKKKEKKREKRRKKKGLALAPLLTSILPSLGYDQSNAARKFSFKSLHLNYHLISFWIIFACNLTVGCCSSIGLRTRPFWGSRGIATPIDMEQSTTSRFRIVFGRRIATRQFNDPRTILYRPLPMPPRQHFRIPGKKKKKLIASLLVAVVVAIKKEE